MGQKEAKESPSQKTKRLRSRKQVVKWTYRKGVFIEYPNEVQRVLALKDIIIRLHATGQMDDGTEFMQITIEGIQ